MNLRRSQPPRGIALIIVMVTILVLSVLAGGFAYSMKVETKLARNANSDTELYWIGRSGIELARFVLLEQTKLSCEPYHSLNQVWAGGPGGFCTTNSPLAGFSLKDIPLGNGYIRSVKMVDLERKLNINLADQALLEHALILMGVDPGEASPVISAILDWIDADDDTHISGAEDNYYKTLSPPYYAKNRPIDDLSELLLVRGVTPEMYWGAACTNRSPGVLQRQLSRLGRVRSPFYSPIGFVDVFSPLSAGKININTASAMALQAIPFIDENRAQQIIRLRSGFDGQEGTEDDTPAGSFGMSVLDMLVSAGLSQPEAMAAARYLDQRSRTFEVTVDAELNGRHRLFCAVLSLGGPGQIPPIVSFYWKEPSGS